MNINYINIPIQTGLQATSELTVYPDV